MTPKSALQTYRRIWAAVFIVAAAIVLWTFSPIPPLWVEDYYSRGVFRGVASVLVPLSSAVPLSLTFVGMVGGAVFFAWAWGRTWRRFRREKKSHWSGVWWGAKWFAFLSVFGYALFLILWGAGYRRVPLAVRLELGDDSPSTSDMAACAEELLDALKRSAPPPRDRDASRALRAISDSMAARVRGWDGKAVPVPSRVKALPAGLLLSFGSAGVTSPFLLEPHVDAGLSDVEFVSVAAHEFAHVAGFCTEAEADLAAYLAGLEADDPFARYAVALSLFVEIARQSDETDRERLLAALPRVAREDRRKARDARLRYRIAWLSKAQSFLYDSYLKSQGVEEGIRNYARGVRHFALAWRKGMVRMTNDE